MAVVVVVAIPGISARVASAVINDGLAVTSVGNTRSGSGTATCGAVVFSGCRDMVMSLELVPLNCGLLL